MAEYLEMRHMEPVDPSQHQSEAPEVHYLNWMSVLRMDSLTTKIRNVLFMANIKTFPNNVSLNSTIYPGPKLQTEIFDLLVSNRQFEFTISGNITKMFRQFLIPEDQRDKLRIIWRPNKEGPLQEFRMRTVTYGTDCAPWQAIRGLHQVADDNAPDEETKIAIKQRMYMDDAFTGSDSIEGAQELIRKITETLAAGKLPITKWASNHAEVLEKVDPKDRISAYTEEGKDAVVKTLGLLFNHTNDTFCIDVKEPKKIEYTKRGMLSVLAGIFDPTGVLLPTVMKFRIYIQMLWMRGYDWDSTIDEELKKAGVRALQESRQKL